MSVYTYRLRAASGLDATLIKELRWYLGLKKHEVRLIPGRKTVEVQGNQEMLFRLLSRSRIVEDIQLKVGPTFMARGEKELDSSLRKIPFHCYLPIKDHDKFKMPQVSAKSHKSKLYHTHLVRNLLLSHIVELPVQRAFKRQPSHLQVNYAGFKKEWLQKFNQVKQNEPKFQQAQQSSSAQNDDVLKTQEFKGLDQVRQHLQDKAKEQRELKELSKITLILNKDQGEILLDTTYEDDLSKHGMKPYVRWGVLNETLAAACILESGLLERAKKTGKLYLWDPFCGTGSFLLEALMSSLDQPVRKMDGAWPFEQWPIHDKELFERFRQEIEEVNRIKHDMDIRIIGSDVSIRAIETAQKNMDFADIDRYLPYFKCESEHQVINDPLIFAEYWPRMINNESTSSSSLINFKDSRRKAYLSLYHGDFNLIGQRLKVLTNDFEDFTLLMNVPYGYQSAEKQHMDVRDTQNLYRRLGRFLQTIPVESSEEQPQVSSLEYAININEQSSQVQTVQKKEESRKAQIFVLAKSRHYGHDLSFEKFSNCGWSSQLHFSNGGLSVNLLKLDKSKLSQVKHTISAYQSIANKTIRSDKSDVVNQIQKLPSSTGTQSDKAINE